MKILRNIIQMKKKKTLLHNKMFNGKIPKIKNLNSLKETQILTQFLKNLKGCKLLKIIISRNMKLKIIKKF